MNGLQAKSVGSAISRALILALLVFAPLARAAVQPWAVTVIHLITLVAVTAFALEKTLSGSWRWIATPLDKPILALLALGTVSAAISPLRAMSFWALLLLINYVVFFYLLIHAFDTPRMRQILLWTIFGTAAFLALFGMVKLGGHNPFPWWQYSHRESDLGSRLSSTFGNVNHLAGYLEMVIPLVLAAFLFVRRGPARALLFGLAALFFSAHALTLSRGGWASLGAGLIFMAALLFIDPTYRHKKKLAIVCSGFFLALVVALGTTRMAERLGALDALDQSPGLSARVQVWGGIVKMIQDSPVLGTGPGTFAEIFTQYQPPGHGARYFYGHNDYLHWISETGLGLLPVMAWMALVVYRDGIRRFLAKDRRKRALALGCMTGITAIAVHSIGDFGLHMPANALLFTVLAAFTVSPAPSQK